MPGYGDLYSFQRQGVHFLNDCPPELSGNNHRLLADDPGLGKTPQACVAIEQRKAQTGLIICPAPIKTTWARQLRDWGNGREANVMNHSIDYPGGDWVIVNYELLVRKDSKVLRTLLKRKFDVCVVDEAHRLKTAGSKTSDLLLGGQEPLLARADSKWLLTGTFMPNRPIELYPVLATLAPETIKGHTRRDDYGRYFCSGYHDGQAMNYTGASHVDELATRIRPFMLRREIKDVYQELPHILESEVFLDIGEIGADESNTPMATLRKMVGQAKVPHALDYLHDRLANDGEEKLLVFAYSQTVIEGLQEGLKKYGAEKFYGPMSSRQKADALESFTKSKGCRVLVAQVNAAGEGIDGLQHFCNQIVYVEIDWSDGGNRQQIGRLHRVGQRRIVYVTSLVAQKTLDDSIVRSASKKRKVTNLFYRVVKGRADMSLEDALKENTEAVRALSTLLLSKHAGEVLVSQEPAKGNDKPAASKPAKAAASGTATTSTASKTIVKDAPPVPSAEDLKKAAVATLKKHGGGDDAKAAVNKIWEKVGATALANVPEGNRADAIALLEELRNGDLPEDEDEDDMGI